MIKFNKSSGNYKKKYTFLKMKVFECFYHSGEVVEVRIVGVWGTSPAWDNEYAKGIVSGYFDKYKAFNEVVSIAMADQQSNIYITLQVINPKLIGRAHNRLVPSGKTTSDKDVLFYRWIPIDIDPKRPAGISSTDSELQNAIEVRDMIKEYILDTTEYTDLITAVSGNGAHILIRLPEDLPVNEENVEFVKTFIGDVSDRFSNEYVDIDKVVYNPARIWKLYGTKAMKGDEVPGNDNREALKHRKSYIDDMGELINV